jgi:hypothetical protein
MSNRAGIAIVRRAASVAGVLGLWAVLAAQPAAAATTDGPLPTVGPSGVEQGRLFEKVSPDDKNGQGVSTAGRVAQASANGERLVYTAVGGFAGTPSSVGTVNYLATRDPATGAWTTTPTNPPGDAMLTAMPAYSQLLDRQFWVQGGALTPEAQPEAFNAYVADMSANNILTVTPKGPGRQLNVANAEFWEEEPHFWYAGASNDLSHILIETDDVLNDEAPTPVGTNNIYEWVKGRLRLASILPNGQPAPGGASAGIGMPQNLFTLKTNYPGAKGNNRTETAISEDGSRIVWTDLENGQIYLRENGEVTIPVSESALDPNNPNPGPATWLYSSPDGSRVFFYSPDQLTEPGAGGDVYEFNVDTHSLTDVTYNASNPGQTYPLGVIGSSRDGSYLYFAALGELTPGSTFIHNNVYLLHDGQLSLVADLGEWNPQPLDPNGNWTIESGVGGSPWSGVSPSGTLYFETAAPVIAYDSAGQREVYVYQPVPEALSCASCRPDGQPPHYGSGVMVETTNPGAGSFQQNGVARLMNPLSSDGSRLFFSSAEPLVKGVTPGLNNVYEWHEGRISLVSSGNSSDDEIFVAASPSGEDVFFTTTARLTAADRDQLSDVYDAKVGGRVPPTAGGCPSGGCPQETPMNAPDTGAPASATAAGEGNLPRRHHKRRHHKHRHHGRARTQTHNTSKGR